MVYQKQHSQDSIRVQHKEVRGHGYLFVVMDYAYKELRFNTNTGKYVQQYCPFRMSTGMTLDRKYWAKEGLNDLYRQDHGIRKFSELLNELENAKKDVFNAYEELLGELGSKPSPDQIKERLLNKKSKSVARMPLATYITELAQSKKVKDKKTKMKYNTLATYIRAVEVARKEHPTFRKMSEGKGVMFLDSFGLKDWSDIELMVQEVSTDIPRTFVKHGVVGIKFDGIGFYAEATLEKIQANLLAVLRRASRDPDLKISMDLTSLEKIRIRSGRKVHLTPEEIQKVIQHKFKQPYLENARQLMVVHLLTGVRISDLSKILSTPIRDVQARRTKIKVVYLSTHKTGQAICLPMFQPVLDILQSKKKPHMVAGATLNLYYKEVAAKIGLDRIIHIVERKANSTTVDHQDELFKVITTHDCRRSFFSMLTGYLFVSRILATQATGHRLSNAQGEDEGYFQLGPEHMAESLLAQALLSQDNIPFDLLPIGFQENWEASKTRRNKS